MILVEKELVFNLSVVPNSKDFAIVSFDRQKNLLKIKAKSKPQKGNANKEIEQKTKELFKAKTRIISGLKSRHKKLLVEKTIEFENLLKNL